MSKQGTKLAKLIDKLAQAEKELVRAHNKWNKLRLTIRRVEKKLDAEFIAAHGPHDTRALNDSI